MMGEFKLLYGNDKKMQLASNMAQFVFNPLCLGYWDASTNTPTLIDGSGGDKEFYLVNVPGTQNLGSGDITFEDLDVITYDGNLAVWK